MVLLSHQVVVIKHCVVFFFFFLAFSSVLEFGGVLRRYFALEGEYFPP